jgi:hypothetical protein
MAPAGWRFFLGGDTFRLRVHPKNGFWVYCQRGFRLSGWHFLPQIYTSTHFFPQNVKKGSEIQAGELRVPKVVSMYTKVYNMDMLYRV